MLFNDDGVIIIANNNKKKNRPIKSKPVDNDKCNGHRVSLEWARDH